MAALLPLSFDESYYWLWSKHLAASYYDHPPAIAFIIRLGTAIFGDTILGIRVVPVIMSAIASLAVWRAGADLTGREEAGATASLYFNLTLMASVETMTATPDAPLVCMAAVLVWALARLERTGEARWWLAVGVAGGLALLSKYTAGFLGLGVLAWLATSPSGRYWARTYWPWIAGALALAIFSPVIRWNAQHDWISFRFQFAKAGDGHFAPHYLIEFLAGQIALATPAIFVLGVIGLIRNRIALLTALAAPAALFFTEHALHARVQGNWPSFLYPAFAIAAAGAIYTRAGSNRIDRLIASARSGAVPVALIFLAVAYGQALTGFLPMRDPTAHLLASGFVPVAERVEAIREGTGAAGVLTTSYATTGWLGFYLPGHPPVVQIGESYRWLAAPKASASLLSKPLLYVVEPRRDRHARLAHLFAQVERLTQFERMRNGRVVSRYNVYLVSGWRGVAAGRVTNGP